MDNDLRVSRILLEHNPVAHLQQGAHSGQAPSAALPEQLDPPEVFLGTGSPARFSLQREHSVRVHNDRSHSVHRRGSRSWKRGQGEQVQGQREHEDVLHPE